MTSTHPLAGVYAAAVTPLRELHGSTLDLESVPVLLNFLASRGCHGAVLFGTTGEIGFVLFGECRDAEGVPTQGIGVAEVGF